MRPATVERLARAATVQAQLAARAFSTPFGCDGDAEDRLAAACEFLARTAAREAPTLLALLSAPLATDPVATATVAPAPTAPTPAAPPAPPAPVPPAAAPGNGGRWLDGAEPPALPSVPNLPDPARKRRAK